MARTYPAETFLYHAFSFDIVIGVHCAHSESHAYSTYTLCISIRAIARQKILKRTHILKVQKETSFTKRVCESTYGELINICKNVNEP